MSEHEDIDGKPQLLYNRERRLKNASSEALFATSLHSGAKRGFFRSLVATRGLRLGLLAIALTMAVVFIYQFLGGTKSKREMEGFYYELQATWFEGDVYLSLTRQPVESGLFPKEVFYRVVAGDEAREGVLEAGQTELRLKLPASSKPERAGALIHTGGSKIEIISRIN